MKQYTMDDYHNSNMKMKLSKKKDLDKPTCFMYQLCQIKGVSLNIAKAIVAKHPSWISLYKTLEAHTTEYEKFDYISRIQVPINKSSKASKASKVSKTSTKKKRSNTRKIGQVIGARIYNFMFS